MFTWPSHSASLSGVREAVALVFVVQEHKQTRLWSDSAVIPRGAFSTFLEG